jgi:branched-chain amino acid transport system permease protein
VNFDLLGQLFVDGLVAGSAYALLGVSFGLIYGPTRIVHFAHGSAYAFAAYGMWTAAAVLHWPLLLAALAGLAAAAVAGVFSYLVAYRPLQGKNDANLGLLITSLGIYIVFENLIGIVFGSDTKILSDHEFGVYVLGSVVVTELQALMIALAVLSTALVAALLRWTALGRSARAMTDNPNMAVIIGIDTRAVSVVVFMLGSMICALPAMVSLLRDGAQPQMGFIASFAGYVVVMVGGVGSFWGTVAAGFLLGLIEHVGMLEMPTEWQSTIAFAALVIVLLVMPRGLAAGRA